MPSRVTAVVPAAILPALLLGGCALQFIEPARDNAVSDRASTVIEGRINYEIDGISKAPYGAFRPKWLAPRLTALRLESRTLHASPAVNDSDGSFRWRLPPGSYLLTKIGTGSFVDDTYIAWPGVILCVPESQSAVRYAGHLHLAGASNAEIRAADGSTYRSRVVAYSFSVSDERATPDKQAVLFHLDRSFPIGDRLLTLLDTQGATLAHQACPSPQ